MSEEKRKRPLNRISDYGKGPVIYWMSRDQRAKQNWALTLAQRQALELNRPLLVVFCLVPEFLNAAARQYAFMLAGLREVEEGLREKGIPFFLLSGDPVKTVASFARNRKAAALFCDFDPLRLKRQWKKKLVSELNIPFIEVDAHNIVPCWEASDKQEFAARTFRPRIHRQLYAYLRPLPVLRRHPFRYTGKTVAPDWEAETKKLRRLKQLPGISWIAPGEDAARKQLKKFIRTGLEAYDEQRNDPCADGQSGLSPYLHFGHISAQKVAVAVRKSGASADAVRVFLEELVVRRELSDNFCFYNTSYDSAAGFPEWAQKTISEHRGDAREYIYKFEEFENARTHDPLWNAAQKEMVLRGKMHGYMRMYWAKKILEWTDTPETAMETAIVLNDRYELDGRDPNGYTGVAWSIGGVHDRAWNEREVFGKIRYMNANGCRRKFDADRYIRNVARYEK